MTEGQLQLRDKNDLEWVLSTEQGRRFLWRILAECGVFHDIEGLPEVAFRQIGRRQIGLFLVDIITTDFPDYYILMQQEQHNRIKEERAEHERANSTDNRSKNGTVDELIGNYDYRDPYGAETDVRSYVDVTSGHIAGI